MKTAGDLAELARPDLPKPACRVMLVCGPPAAGKSSYVNAHRAPGDIVIDLDDIAREHGFGRDRPSSQVGNLLIERNARLAKLCEMSPDMTAWVILGAPSASLRQWWADVLGVQPDDMILIVPSRNELRRRIWADPDRRYVRGLHMRLVDKWFGREHDDNPGLAKRGCGADGFPTDPLHPWNRARNA